MGHNALHNNPQAACIIRAMQGLERKIAKLAPHPDRPNYTGPLSVAKDPRCAVAGEHDAMLATLCIEASFGAYSSGVAKLCNAIDAADEIYVDRTSGKYELGVRNSLGETFNHRSTQNNIVLDSKTAARVAYEYDLPVRQKLEGQYAAYSRRLDLIQSADRPRHYQPAWARDLAPAFA